MIASDSDTVKTHVVEANYHYQVSLRGTIVPLATFSPLSLRG